MTATFTVTRTDEVLAAMLTENTGRHMLDSGGAYGRNWERNQGRTVESFLAAEPVTLSARYGYVDVTLDLFHWLRDRLEYDAELDARFHAFAEDSTDPWLADMKRFAEETGGSGHDYLNGTYNSYNGEELLSQTIQFLIGTDESGEEYVLLQIHGGCDVRGGYTAPRAFRPATYEVADLFDWDAYELYCTAGVPQAESLPGMPEPEQHALSYRNGEWITWGGSFDADPWNGREAVVEPEDGEPYVACPHCGAPMEAGEYPVG